MGSVLPSSLPFLGDEGHTIDAVGDVVFNIYQHHIMTYLEVLLKSMQPEWPPQRRVLSKMLVSAGWQEGLGREWGLARLCEVTPLQCPGSCFSHPNARLPWRHWDVISPGGSDGSEMSASSHLQGCHP